MVGCRNDHGVDVRAVQYFAVVEVSFDRAVFLSEILFRAADPLLVNVANTDNLAFAVALANLGKGLGYVTASAAGSNDGDIDAVVST